MLRKSALDRAPVDTDLDHLDQSWSDRLLSMRLKGVPVEVLLFSTRSNEQPQSLEGLRHGCARVHIECQVTLVALDGLALRVEFERDEGLDQQRLLVLADGLIDFELLSLDLEKLFA